MFIAQNTTTNNTIDNCGKDRYNNTEMPKIPVLLTCENYSLLFDSIKQLVLRPHTVTTPLRQDLSIKGCFIITAKEIRELFAIGPNFQ